MLQKFASRRYSCALTVDCITYLVKLPTPRFSIQNEFINKTFFFFLTYDKEILVLYKAMT